MLDVHLLEGTPRGALVEALLREPPPSKAARPYYEGMRLLGSRTPELALVALRLTLAGLRPDDRSVVRLRDVARAALQGGAQAARAREEYAALLKEPPRES